MLEASWKSIDEFSLPGCLVIACHEEIPELLPLRSAIVQVGHYAQVADMAKSANQMSFELIRDVLFSKEAPREYEISLSHVLGSELIT